MTITNIFNVNQICSLLKQVVLDCSRKSREKQNSKKCVIDSNWTRIANIFDNLILSIIERFVLLFKKFEIYKFDIKKINLLSLIIVLIESIFANKSILQRKQYRKLIKLISFETISTKKIERTFVNKSSENNK